MKKKIDNTLHETFMRKCIELALVAKNRGDSPVGSVLVKNGIVIAQGIEAGKTNKDITFHAEIEAIRNANKYLNSQDLSDCTLYTTHEPCIMCSYVIRHTQVNKVVIGIATPNTGGYSSKLKVLSDTSVKTWQAPPELIFGVLESACEALGA
jgi:tRNA(adenine34) deaminase